MSHPIGLRVFVCHFVDQIYLKQNLQKENPLFSDNQQKVNIKLSHNHELNLTSVWTDAISAFWRATKREFMREYFNRTRHNQMKWIHGKL